jgi:diadenosine tetraphosphatase ApaH/serine/threonine PP2A family protein phosphatase
MFLEEQNCRLCFVGHTHTPAILSTDGAYEVDSESRFHLGDTELFFVNPGSVGQPRDDDPRASFGLLDTESNTFQLLRVAYPVEQAAKRVLDAKLPRFLADRLLVGR